MEYSHMKNCIIFDCDGVLVDSEILAHQGDVETLLSMGYPITIEESIKRFTGVNDNSFRQIIFEEAGIVIPDDFFERRRKDLLKTFEADLKPLIETTLSFLSQKKINQCVASSSSRERVIRALELTGQHKFFSGSSIFTSQQVQRGKPAPDLFLFAADQMGYSHEECIVIEDSVPGINAAIAANMSVIGFLGGSHAQYDWYKNNIKSFNIPIAYNEQELLELLMETLP
jgi:HAD superfamily hydrolase (TIGR01509 family)